MNNPLCSRFRKVTTGFDTCNLWLSHRFYLELHHFSVWRLKMGFDTHNRRSCPTDSILSYFTLPFCETGMSTIHHILRIRKGNFSQNCCAGKLPTFTRIPVIIRNQQNYFKISKRWAVQVTIYSLAGVTPRNSYEFHLSNRQAHMLGQMFQCASLPCGTNALKF